MILKPPPAGWNCTTGRPVGMIMAGAGWTLETVDLENVCPAKVRSDGILGQVNANANGMWIMITRIGRVFYVRTLGEAQRIVGADWAAIRTLKRWAYAGPVRQDGTW